ncbi:MAG: hypothetical protein AABW72_01460 [archaeon]
MAKDTIKSKKDNRQIINLILAIIMLTSIVGFAFLMSPKQQTDDNKPPITEQPQTITFTADKVNATVKNTLSVVKLSGYTKETNINELDKKLFSVKGISNVLSSSFSKDPNNNMLIYVAEITTKMPDENISEFVYQIQKSVGLLNIYAAKKALLKIPKTVKMKNADLNIEKEFEFEQPFTEALVELATIPDDKIEISLVITSSGSKIISRTAYETNNISLLPEQYSTEAMLKINELNYSLVFSGPIDYNGFDVNILETALMNELPGINFARIELDAFEPVAYLGILKTALVGNLDQNVIKEALQNNLGSLAIINNLEFSEDENKFIVKLSVNGQENYSFVISLVSDYLKDLGLNDQDFGFKPITVDIMGEARFGTKELYDTTLSLEKILKNNGIIIIARQKATVSLNEPLTANGQTHNYDENFVGLLIPKHVENEVYKIKVNFAVQRGKVTVIQAVENKDLIDVLKEKPIVIQTE